MRNIAHKVIFLLAMGASPMPVFAQYAPGIPTAGYMIFALTIKSLRQCELQHLEFSGALNKFESEFEDRTRNIDFKDEHTGPLSTVFSKVKSTDIIAEKITLEECKWYWENRQTTIDHFVDEVLKQNEPVGQ